MQKLNMIVICQPKVNWSVKCQATQKQEIISYSIATAVMPILMAEMDFWCNFSYCRVFEPEIIILREKW